MSAAAASSPLASRHGRRERPNAAASSSPLSFGGKKIDAGRRGLAATRRQVEAPAEDGGPLSGKDDGKENASVLTSRENRRSPVKKVGGSGGGGGAAAAAARAGGKALRVKRLSDSACLPRRASKRAAGYDLASAHDTVVPAHGKALIKTDLSVAIPPGTYGRIAPRSSLALKMFIDVGAGVIDEDYRGPLGVVLFNHSENDFEVKRGDRIAQLILERITTPEVEEVGELDATERGEGGFGSTGR